MRLGILTSHPIQYQAPWFRALPERCELQVFFAHRQSPAEQGRAGFGTAFDWDVDLLSGYEHRFLTNVSSSPSVNHYSGCDTPEIVDIILNNSKLETGTSNPFHAFIICGWYLRSYLQAARACRVANIPVLVRGDSQLRTPRSALKRLTMEVRQRWLLRRFDAFLSPGKRHREYLQHFGVPREKIFFVPHFVDNEWFRRKAETLKCGKAEIRRKWGANDNDLVALFVGKFTPKKRPADLLRALATLNSQTSNVSFLAVFVGSGELENELREIAAREKIRAHFAGFKNQTELPACYTAADVLVLPSESETWGLVVNEAMACGLPAIVSDVVGCAPDIIEEGETGFTFPVGEVSALAERLATFAKLKTGGHNFKAPVAEKMSNYGVEAAVEGTLRSVSVVSGQ